MHCAVETKDIQDIENSNIPQQTSFWAEVKYKQGMEPLAFHYSITRDMLSPVKSSA